MLGISDRDNLGILTINGETIDRQVVSDDITDNSKRHGQCKRTIQIEGGKCEQFESEKQDAEAQSQQNADNTAEPTICTNPTVTGNNNNKNDFFVETVNKDSDSFFQSW